MTEYYLQWFTEPQKFEFFTYGSYVNKDNEQVMSFRLILER